MESLERYRRALEGLLGVPATEGNVVELLRDGVEIFPAMLEAIDTAQRTVDLLTFVYWKGQIAEHFAESLCRRARAGVRCRVILDSLGARHVEKDVIASMEDAGVLLHWFRPLVPGNDPGHRTHRKVLICDEQVAFTGGVGIADEWDGSSDEGTGWRETQVRLQGPVVDGLRAAFVDDWMDAEHVLFDDADRFPEQPQDGDTTAMVIRGESEHGWSDGALLRRALLDLAQERVRITTAYLAPDPAMIEALTRAVARGVQVQILHPGPQTDKEIARLAAESVYDDLLAGGVELWEFQPTMLHAKVLTVDRQLSVVGSSNLNTRSLSHDEEVDVVLFDAALTAELDRHTDQDLTRAERVDETWNQRSPARWAPQKLVTLIDHWT
ncbi:phospholipase D-like domain-containing protein [Egicoccus halophilus]|uniref:Cardiolipin synthase B n=1 Tax=Egicoccus halophilus TaxID=1670830 RepID=A0A8J3AB25_9ACTN|nr:phospholipase D-like domain-containing protein [Egicoccus halophilus]GGI07191.1 cardiolipin synthase B [Egicoccus halophilus]